MYGTIRMHQEREYPGNVFGTNLNNPSFAALARAYGAIGKSVKNIAEFKEVFNTAKSAPKPTLIELKTSPEAISPSTTISKIRNYKK